MRITRRDALTGVTAAVAVAAIPAAVSATPYEPVIGLVDELNRACRVWFDAADTNDGKAVAHWSGRYWNLANQVCETPAVTVRGVLAKLHGFYNESEITFMRRGGVPGNDLGKIWTASIYRDLERLAGEPGA